MWATKQKNKIIISKEAPKIAYLELQVKNYKLTRTKNKDPPQNATASKYNAEKSKKMTEISK